MAHQLAIAKASFSAGLLRPDPTSVPRDDIAIFHSLLEKALSHCSRANIQTCKSWLLQYVVPSSNRSGMLGKYLVALSDSFKPENDTQNGASKNATAPTGSKCSGKRKRLHLLYLISDIFHHTKYHSGGSSSSFVTVSSALQPHIVELVGHAASYDREKNPKHHRRLDQLLEIWAESGYYSAEYVDKLREAVRNSASVGLLKSTLPDGEDGSAAANLALARDAPYVMPPSHGDASTPYYDLPAGNFVPHIIPDSETPIRPDTVKPLQFLAGPADPKLVTAVKKFLKEADRIYGAESSESEKGTTKDFDELGQLVIRDDTTGEIIDGDTYYGWSREFCKQMKKRRDKGRNGSRGQSFSQSRSVSPPRCKRRYSDSISSRSRSRSRSRDGRNDQHSYSRSRSRTRSRRDYHGRRTHSRSRSYSQSRSRSRSYSPRPASPPRSIPQPSAFPQGVPPSHSQFGYDNGQHFPPGASGIPPPPPNYTGPWPPPPPPMPQGSPPAPGSFGHYQAPGQMNLGMNMGMAMGMGMMGMQGFSPQGGMPPYQQQQHQQSHQQSMSPHHRGGPHGSYVPPQPPPPPPPGPWGQHSQGGRGGGNYSGGRGW